MLLMLHRAFTCVPVIIPHVSNYCLIVGGPGKQVDQVDSYVSVNQLKKKNNFSIIEYET